MDNNVLTQLLTEYGSKRMAAISDAEERQQILREKYPEYLVIEDELRSLSLGSLKDMLVLSKEEKDQKIKVLERKTADLLNKKKKFLHSLNLPDDYLAPHFDCSLCNDTGYVDNSLCSCIRQRAFDIEYNKSNISKIKVENFENFDYNAYSDEKKSEYNSQYSPRENMQKIVEISRNFIKNFDDFEEKNLIFIGPTGLGKTFLSNCIAKEVLEMGKTVLYQTAPVMLDEVIKAKFDRDTSQIMDHLINVDLLIIDDLGTETMNSMKFTELFTIINTRLLNQNSKVTKTIISTNMDLKSIFSVYEERIGSRIVGNYNICRFFGEDIRLNKNYKKNSM